MTLEQKQQTLQLTKEEAREIVNGNSKDYLTVENTIISTLKGSNYHRIVVKRLSDGKFFADKYSQGIFDSEEERPFEFSDPNFTQVFPIEKIVYE